MCKINKTCHAIFSDHVGKCKLCFFFVCVFLWISIQQKLYLLCVLLQKTDETPCRITTETVFSWRWLRKGGYSTDWMWATKIFDACFCLVSQIVPKIKTWIYQKNKKCNIKMYKHIITYNVIHVILSIYIYINLNQTWIHNFLHFETKFRHLRHFWSAQIPNSRGHWESDSPHAPWRRLALGGWSPPGVVPLTVANEGLYIYI